MSHELALIHNSKHRTKRRRPSIPESVPGILELLHIQQADFYASSVAQIKPGFSRPGTEIQKTVHSVEAIAHEEQTNPASLCAV
jgi:hypothetical protein